MRCTFSSKEAQYEFILYTDPESTGRLHETRILAEELPSVTVAMDWTMVEVDGKIRFAYLTSDYHHHDAIALIDEW